MKTIRLCVYLLCGLSAALSAQEYEWQKPHAEVLVSGDLKWAPQPFVFQKGTSTRYVDFENGKDSNDGNSINSAWKHHPWDSNATGKAKSCSGIHTYVFKRGVIYRGSLVASESGEANNPIRLTSDPSWGTGEAMLSGADLVSGWKQGNAHKDIPDADKVWSVDLSYAPRFVWMILDGQTTIIPIARTPNWTVSNPEDVMSEWFEWEQPTWWEAERHKTTVGKTKMHKGTDNKHLTEKPAYYEGAYLWTEWSVVMSTPFPTKVEAVVDGGLAFQGPWFRDSGSTRTGNRYFLEDNPQYLDAAGEYWFDKKQDGSGRLYLRLPDDRDPNSVIIEAAHRYSIIEDTASAKAPSRLDILGDKKNDPDTVSTAGVKHLEISGLGFQFNNTWWDLEFPVWMHNQVDSAAIRLRGSSNAIRISHCHFTHVVEGIQIEPINIHAHNGHISITDNLIEFCADAAIAVGKGAGTVQHVDFLRNYVQMIGMRPNRQSSGHAVNINFPITMHVAGNMLNRVYGSGLFLFGGKGSGQGGDVPLSRHLVHHNRVDQSLLAANDWGGIETWQGGPFYLYNNISSNPGGLWQARIGNPEFGARLGFAYYLDGGFKNYLFNNIAWGANNDKHSDLANAFAFYEAVGTIHNSFMNNTIYRFQSGSSWDPRGGHHHFAGNLWSDITDKVYVHGKLKEDLSETATEYAHGLISYGPDVFHEIKGNFGIFENLVPKEEKMKADFASMETAIKKHQTLNATLGLSTDKAPMRDPANRDMRLSEGSAAIDKGVIHFVPWGLYGMVAEWNFYHDGKSVNQIPDEHWYMNDYLVDRSRYHEAPQYPLEVVNVTEENYVAGPLEDWIKGALNLNGKDQFAVLRHVNIDKPYTYKDRNQEKTVEGSQLKNVDIHDHNFLIEMYLKTEAGQSSGILVKKLGDTGYALTLNKKGGVTLSLTSKESASIDSKTAINDGKWHHVIVEADRKSKSLTVYIDGKQDNAGAGIGLVSLLNTADFYVGGSEKGDCLHGTIEFVRVCHGTLNDARTTIDELYTWQFDGPQLRDFLGNKPSGKRDAGALEAQP